MGKLASNLGRTLGQAIGPLDTTLIYNDPEALPYHETDLGKFNLEAGPSRVGLTPEGQNLYWSPQQFSGESETDYASRLERARTPYGFDLASLNPFLFSEGSVLSNTGLGALLGLKGGGLADYPRRDLLVEGPGTERSDDIPAMLSDGEFVINARAVRGADPTGKGDRYRGANNLYNMMRNFEMRA